MGPPIFFSPQTLSSRSGLFSSWRCSTLWLIQVQSVSAISAWHSSSWKKGLAMRKSALASSGQCIQMLVCTSSSLHSLSYMDRARAGSMLHMGSTLCFLSSMRDNVQNSNNIWKNNNWQSHEKKSLWNDGHSYANRHNKPKNWPSPPSCWSCKTFSSCRGFPFSPPPSFFASPLTSGFLKQETSAVWLRVPLCADWTCKNSEEIFNLTCGFFVQYTWNV